jgi:hypothetical protein
MGRPRKASTSTVVTVDKVYFPWLKETSVLKSTTKDMDDEDCPIFLLHDAVIYEKDGRTLGNPLLLDKVGPMVVRGRIERRDDDDNDDELHPLLPYRKFCESAIPVTATETLQLANQA